MKVYLATVEFSQGVVRIIAYGLPYIRKPERNPESCLFQYFSESCSKSVRGYGFQSYQGGKDPFASNDIRYEVEVFSKQVLCVKAKQGWCSVSLLIVKWLDLDFFPLKVNIRPSEAQNF